MSVYCKEAPGCDHERDACAASRGERCVECGHGSAAILSYTPGPRWAFAWFPAVNPRKRKPLKKAAQARWTNARAKNKLQ
ncbi:MAG: hypothetical protein HW378_2491 [Anaerolineales bacterium]|nr:hypothetical protein [Anaerolineales bacterium]